MQLKHILFAAATAFVMMSMSPATRADEASLYQRLGGYDAIRAVTNDVAARLVADPKLGRFWVHRGKDGIEREVQLIVDFIANQSVVRSIIAVGT